MDKLIGLYWYCNDYHSSMWSWQYQVLSNSTYRPSWNKHDVFDESEEAQAYYQKLVDKFEHGYSE